MDDLECAVREGDADTIKRLLLLVFPPKADMVGQSSGGQLDMLRLFELCLRRHVRTQQALPCLQTFFDHGFDIREYDQENCMGRPDIPWHTLASVVMACKHNLTDLVRLFLSNGADPNMLVTYRYAPLELLPQGPSARSILFFACSLPFIELSIVDALLTAGANVDFVDVDFDTPLHAAVSCQRADVATMLVARGANVNAVNRRNETPLFCALIWEHSRSEVVKMFLNHGVSLDDSRLGYPHSQKSYAVRAVDQARPHLGVLRRLVDHGADLSRLNFQGLTVLHLACSRLDIDMVKFLLTVKFGPDVVSRGMLTPLDYVLWPSRHGAPQLEVVVVLRAAGACMLPRHVDTAMSVCTDTIKRYIVCEARQVLSLSVLCKKTIRTSLQSCVLPGNSIAAYRGLLLPSVLIDELLLKRV